MKYCTKCGQQVEDNTSYCPNCGYHFTDSNSSDNYFDDNFGSSQSTGSTNGSFSSTSNQPDNLGKNETSTIGILSIIFGALGGWLGLVFGIMGLAKYKKKSNRILSAIGLSLFLFWILLYIILDI